MLVSLRIYFRQRILARPQEETGDRARREQVVLSGLGIKYYRYDGLFHYAQSFRNYFHNPSCGVLS